VGLGWYVVERAAVCGVEMGGVKRCKEHSPWRWDVWGFWEQGYGHGVGVRQGGWGLRGRTGGVGQLLKIQELPPVGRVVR